MTKTPAGLKKYFQETNPALPERGCYIRTMTARVQLQEKPQGAWCQDELIGGKPPVVK
jgi:hypothetical protein